MTNKKVDISLQVHQVIHPRRIAYEEANVFQKRQNPIDKFQVQYLPKEKRFTLVEKGNVINESCLPMPKDRKESTIIENYGIDEIVGELLINWQLQRLDVQNNESYKPFHLLDCGENLRLRFEAYECLETYMLIQMNCDGFDYLNVSDNLKWYPSKKGRFMNKDVCDGEIFFSSNWPDLRTNRLQEGGYDAISAASYFNTPRRQ
ncbi:hypothetical protein PVK06_024581 [Gossypium arboreum]|uniref:Uncharacterized protein n=1 Tax=Gossypium arboreum TaxID=29729 RepID=A0ABR0PEQ7_GOSAR|nr:hypothetical protein PVK06_024581 [Gossypium arboreum]